MQLFKKFPFLLGWLGFCLSTWLFQWLLGLLIIPYTSFGFLMVIYVVVSFFTFGLSIGLITLPLYRERYVTAERANRVSLISYLPRWLLFLVYFAVYCIPLSIKGLLPANLQMPFHFAWSLIASFLAYRGVVRSWLDDAVLRLQQDSEKRVLTA